MTINIVKLHAAAFYFAFYSQNAGEISGHIGVSERTITRWAETVEWSLALDDLGYTGAREFSRYPRREVSRESGSAYAHAKSVYVGLLRDGTPPHKVATLTAEQVKRPVGTIRRWARIDNWKGEVA